jgi:hypothetical protein
MVAVVLMAAVGVIVTAGCGASPTTLASPSTGVPPAISAMSNLINDNKSTFPQYVTALLLQCVWRAAHRWPSVTRACARSSTSVPCWVFAAVDASCS